MAPRIDPRLRVGARRAASSVVHAVGMQVLDLSRGTIRYIDRVPGAFVAQMVERVGMTALLQASTPASAALPHYRGAHSRRVNAHCQPT